MPKGVDGEFVHRMEDVLEPYAEPYDPKRPVACSDEASKELRGPVAGPAAVAPGKPAEEGYEYARNGTADLFASAGPLAGGRQVAVADRRTIPDFAAQMKYLCDETDPEAEVIRVVLDNLNTHAPGSLFATYPPDEAWRLVRRPEFHSTPKHASWLNVAECELSTPSRRCLGRRIPGKATLITGVAARQEPRNRAKARTEWTFRVADARRKSDFLYPKELVR